MSIIKGPQANLLKVPKDSLPLSYHYIESENIITCGFPLTIGFKKPKCYTETMDIDLDLTRSEGEQDDIFWNQSSLEQLHAAQDFAMHGEFTAAKERIAEAIASASRIRSTDAWVSQWLAYLRATQAYFSYDQATVESLHDQCGMNRSVVANLLRGLKENSTLDYQRDYRR